MSPNVKKKIEKFLAYDWQTVNKPATRKDLQDMLKVICLLLDELSEKVNDVTGVRQSESPKSYQDE